MQMALHSLATPRAAGDAVKTPAQRGSSGMPPAPTHLRSLTFLRELGSGLAGLVFLTHPWVGAVVALLLLRFPWLAAGGTLALSGALGMASLLGLRHAFLRYPPYIFNAVLAGLATLWAVPDLKLALGLALVAGACAFLVNWWIAHQFAMRGLPVLSLPFILVVWLLQMALPRGSESLVQNSAVADPALAGHSLTEVTTSAVPLSISGLAEGFLSALGWTFFLPDMVSGTVIALLLLIASRILFVLAVGGYLAGQGALMLLGTHLAGPQYPFAFNFILVAMALGGALLKPSLRTLCIALCGAALAAVLGEALRMALAPWGVPPYALAYCIVTLLVLYVLRTAASDLVPLYEGELPERMVERYALHAARGGNQCLVGLPVSGRWQISQGPDGPWTHQGAWRHACDFNLVDDTGKDFTGDGLRLEDYFAWGKPVIAPTDGIVARVVMSLPDEPPGTVNLANNWGNYVVLYDARGFYVLLAHLAQQSVVVQEGQHVIAGTLLARVGNSGYSPTPHLHMQVQATADAGTASLPFQFGNVLVDGQFQANYLPAMLAKLEAAPQDDAVRWALSFKLDDQIAFDVGDARIDGEAISIRRLRCVVRMGLDGCFYLESGLGQLWFARDAFRFRTLAVTGHDPDLEALGLALSTVSTARPSSAAQGRFAWHGAVLKRHTLALRASPKLGTLAALFKQSGLDLRSWLQPHAAVLALRAHWSASDTIIGEIGDGTAHLSYKLRFDEIGLAFAQIGSRSFTRLAV